MPYILEIDGHFIGPFATEADVDARTRQEFDARKGNRDLKASLHFLLPPHLVEPGGPYNVPFVIIKEDGTAVQLARETGSYRVRYDDIIATENARTSSRSN
jgi:hypothetical protein